MFSAEQAKGLSMVFLQSVGNEIPITRRVLAAVPDAQLDFKLGEKGRTTRELMWHIVQSELWFANGIAAGNFDSGAAEGPAPATVADMVAHHEREMPPLIAKIEALSGDKLAAPVSFFGIFNLPAVLYMDFWNKHTVHHRGQLSMQIRAMNAHVPDIYGGSADEPFQMPATA